MPLVAVIDGNENSRREIVETLAPEFSISEAADGLDAVRLVFAERPDAIVLDLRVPGITGFELIRVLRAACDIPIIAIGLADDAQTAVRVLDIGADDFIRRGGVQTELVARIRAVMRLYERQPSAAAPGRLIRTGALVIDRDARLITKHGVPVQLTRTEHRLMEALASRIGSVAPHRFLLSTVWGEACVDDTQYLRAYIGYLRNKIEDEPSRPKYLLNEWGIGYRLANLPIEVAPQSEAAIATGRMVLSAV